MNISKIRQKYFPIKTKNGFTIRASTARQVRVFLKKSFDMVFPSEERSLYFKPTGKRLAHIKKMQRRYDVLHHEWFLFFDPKGNPVGWHFGETEDAVTFYMRASGVLPKFQNQGIYGSFFPQFIDYLSELGYERISSQHKVTNRKILITKLKQGFDVAGIELTERWGALVKLVKIIPRDRKLSFYKQFGEMEHLD